MTFEIEERITSYPIGHIRAEGMITPETPRRLEALLKAQTDLPITSISLSSRGGNLAAALEVGRLLRRYRIVSSVSIDKACLSACAYAFLGGVARAFETGYGDEPEEAQKRLGFHGFTLEMQIPGALEGRNAAAFVGAVTQGSQVTAGGLADYVAAMDANVEIIGRAAPHGRNQYLYLPVSELKKLGILTDYEKNLGEFKLVPDGGNVQAAFIHDDHQFTIGCSQFGGRLQPVLVFTNTFGKSPGAPITPISPPLKLSRILGSTYRPWTSNDIAYKRFHAHSWITGTAWNPVFGYFHMTVGDSDPTTVALTSQNSAFFHDPPMFHAVIVLPPAEVAVLLREKESYVSLGEQPYPESGWSHVLRTEARDREALAYALRSCVK
ncbi:hypothetical protein CSW64_12755 [Caulobacter mirabilis]|uniref:Uncharacterized protein n=2 Tax=Caulobacter mirabilis TaxID=69666 RepID=A0A2D2AYX9_9CAUL|nr:hypothetical protein CSW64_12755 [Caulobacter mirabilis]